MLTRKRNYQWLAMVLLFLAFVSTGGCDNKTKKQDAQTAGDLVEDFPF